ncbi:DUF5675 family protein [Flavihumibacter petaseus]|uniref:DUF5675 domain-containing protein n=1 Tax=Flavihumibacter petaseus NBRC 106054 TaxID=1220578 RepID=A0A0E9N6S5_9BACT|nr:DUF5675 family protein [Flavihumibacter petaseus]GAO45396.1 hypothetical protein FPE01S_05_00910 [Flavihumibacter petaseus NBRC 106054]
MELLLEREYDSSGTSGILSCEERFVCFTIELPWRDNKRMISCIPEGRYPLALRYSERHRWHLQVQNVPGRSLILLHKANNAAKELKGCIAPVSELVRPGVGKRSNDAFCKLMQLVKGGLERREEAWLRLTKL